MAVVYRGCMGNRRDATAALRLRATELRQELTESELLLWTWLCRRQQLGSRWLAQYASGPFIFDFFCPALSLVIEVDGLIHKGTEQQYRDRAKDEFAVEQGWWMVRIPNAMIVGDLGDTMMRLRYVMRKRIWTLRRLKREKEGNP
ncbi:MAG: DUF559 domain-containing protein [bacterium]